MARGRSRSPGSRSCSCTSPREISQTWLCPVVDSSSRPSSPRKTSAVAPRVWNTPTNSGTLSSWATPTADASGRAGLHSGPRKLNTVGMPSSARVGPACLKPGWNRAANANVMPTSSRTCATRSGGIVRSTPSASSTSEEPAAELAALLPCFTTRAPAAAATIDAMVDTFTVPNLSPPVPTMSSAIGSTASGCACASTASRNPTISPTVSPFARRATRKAPSCAPVARPAMTSSIAQEASAIDRSDPARSSVSRAGQLSSDGMASIVPSADIGHNGTVTSTTISPPPEFGDQPAERHAGGRHRLARQRGDVLRGTVRGVLHTA